MKKNLVIISFLTVICLVLVGILFVNMSKYVKVKKLINQCNTFIQESNYAEAKRVYNEAVTLSPKSKSLYQDIAKYYEEKGLMDSAFEVIKKGYENTNTTELKVKLELIKSQLPVTTFEQTLLQNSQYSLSEKVKIKIDNVEQDVSVSWDTAFIDTSKITDYTISGIVKEYERKVVLKLRIEPGIKEIKDLKEVIKQGTEYSLPIAIKATMTDETIEDVPVTWSPAAVDVKNPGVYEFSGTINGFTGKVKLILTINPLEEQVSMDTVLKIKLDTFFSNFSEAYVKPFEESNISNDDLIHFGILHIIINNWGGNNNLVMSKSSDPGNGYIKSSDVDNACYRYFGKKPTTHKSINEFPYEDSCYKFPYASGEAITFSQIDKLFDLGDNFYRAEISVYVGSSGFTGNVHGTINDWKKTDPNNPPTLKNKITAKIKKITEDGNERYILISYK